MLVDFQVQVSKLVEEVLHVRKEAKFGAEEVNSGQNICSRDDSVGNGRILKNKLSPPRVKTFSLSQEFQSNSIFLNTGLFFLLG